MELSHATLPLAGLVLLLSSGCTTVAQVTTCQMRRVITKCVINWKRF